ncbi:hypothetical protein AYO22_02013 [Fonsecaea multimorphosa]|nr:hypothetical protein AYO22_02013 [Fonsecaea multimorphosa]
MTNPVMEVDIAPYEPRSVLETLPCSLPLSHFDTDIDFGAIASPIVQSLGGLTATDLSSTPVWRDVFALTGTIRTFYSADSIAKAWTETCASRQACDFAYIKDSAKPTRLDKDMGWVNISFTFRNQGSPASTCRGILSLTLEDDGHWRIWLIRTILEQLEGCEDVDILPIIQAMPNGVNGDHLQINGTNGSHTAANGANGTNCPPSDFDCVVVGAGQAGLGSAGRLQSLGISYVVLDKNAQIGDNWMTRYDSARLHTAREYNHLPFDRTFPLPYQEFLTKYDLARGYKDWVEKFGVDKHIWFNTTLESGSWDEGRRTWTLCIRRVDGSSQSLTCRHVIMATGGGGQIPIMPQYPGRDVFQGTVLHSAEFKSAEPWRGKAGIVIGTANTAHDVAEDMVEAGLSQITMVQRSRTYVLPYEYFKVISDRSYNADVPTVDADREQYSMPYAVSRLLSRKALHGMAAKEPERFDALERAGFRVERYGDIMWHICEKQGGLAFSDGSETPADVVIFCTGFVGNMRTDVARIFGKDVAARADDFWGLDGEGELKGAFKRNSHPNLYYMGGTIGHARYFSRHVALQIKAELMGTPLPVYEGERR